MYWGMGQRQSEKWEKEEHHCLPWMERLSSGADLCPVHISHGPDHELRFYFKDLTWSHLGRFRSWSIYLSSEKIWSFTDYFYPSLSFFRYWHSIPLVPAHQMSFIQRLTLGLKAMSFRIISTVKRPVKSMLRMFMAILNRQL